MEKQKPFGEKNKQGQQHKPGQEHTGPNKEPKDQAQTLPGGRASGATRSRSGAPFSSTRTQQKPRQPGEGHEEDRPPRSAGV